jgi:transcriptional regulator with PAS, ATPase and Fis domain
MIPRRKARGLRASRRPAMDALGAHDWPGNIRELQNEVERVSLFAGNGERIDLEHLSEKLTPSRGNGTWGEGAA